MPLRHAMAAVSLAAGVTATAPAIAGVPDPAVVRTTDGPVRGTVTADHRSFLGIPYAAPPVGVAPFRARRASSLE